MLRVRDFPKVVFGCIYTGDACCGDAARKQGGYPKTMLARLWGPKRDAC